MQGQLGRVQGGLVTVQHDQLGRAEPVHLPAQFGADRPARAGDQDALASEMPGDRGTSVCTGLRPSRSVIRGSRTPSIRACPVSSSVTEGTTFGASPQLSAGTVRSRIAVPLARAIAMTRTVAPGAGGHLGHPRPVPEHLDALDPQPPFGRIVIQDRNGPVSAVRLTISRQISIEPASPAPNTMTRTVADAGVRERWFGREQHIPCAKHRGQREYGCARDGLQCRMLPGHQRGAGQGEQERHHASGHPDAHDLIQAAALVPAR